MKIYVAIMMAALAGAETWDVTCKEYPVEAKRRCALEGAGLTIRGTSVNGKQRDVAQTGKNGE